MKIRALAAIAAGTLALTACGAAGGIDPPADQTPATTSTTAPPPVMDTAGDVPDPEPVLPEPEDFTLEVIVTSQECFGSAGCLVTYRIEPTVHTDLHHQAQATVIYEVTGGQDGTQIDSFDLLGNDEYTVPAEQVVETPTAGTALEATVTQVVAN